MRSLHIAEWILGLVTSRDRAASTVGDLVEAAATRGGGWFWSGVFRTAASLLWRDVAEHPARMTGLAVGGLAVEIGLSVLALVLAGVAGSAAGILGGWSGPPATSVGWRLFLKLVVDVPIWVTPFVIGRILARWAPGRELAACLAYAILGSAFNIVIMVVFPGSNGLSISGLVGGILSDAAQQSPLLAAGAVWGRRSRRRITS
jgi:hypothetical protein